MTPAEQEHQVSERDDVGAQPLDALTAAEGGDAAGLRDRLGMFAAAADERCAQLRAELAHAEELADLLRAEARASDDTAEDG